MSLATLTVDTASALSREYLSGGPRAALGTVPRVLSRSPDDISREFGPGFWDRVAEDPKVSSSIAILCDAAVGAGPTLTPAITAPKKAPSDPADAPSEADISEARRIAKLCEWNLDRLDRPLDETLKEMLADALVGGCKLAELVYERPGSGEYADTLALRDLKVKPRDAWAFVVDKYFNVLGIQPAYGYESAVPGQKLVPREKFAILTWDMRDRDPRGRSLLRTIYEAWNFKTKLLPEYFQYSQTFAGPAVSATYPAAAPDHDRSIAPGFDRHSRPTITAAEYLAWQLDHFGQNRYLVAPEGTTITVHQPQGKGDPFLAGLDWADGQIVAGILGATRMTQEAQHGSKADSQTATDVVGLRVGRVKAVLRRLVEWDVLWNLVRVNEGREAADKFTPIIRFGEDRKDFTALSAVLTTLNTIGAIQPPMWPAIVDLFGLDIPDPDPEQAQKAQAQAQAQQDQFQQGLTDLTAPAGDQGQAPAGTAQGQGAAA
jgi:hypothetical protein